MQLLPYLQTLEQFGIKFGLHNISALVDRLGHPERAYACVHVAGTNGKGSVTAMVDAALRAAGRRSARYTSPHLVDLTERFVVDGRAVSTDEVEAAAVAVRGAVEALRRDGILTAQPTFFEATTAIAFEIFRRARVDVAVFEVGLGGRLDATNVVAPIATAITSIAFDHQTYLGTTLGEIAAEKAGIVKRGVPVVVGEMPAEADRAIDAIARRCGARVIRARARDVDGMAVGLAGAHQRANAAVALATLRAIDDRGLPVPHEAMLEGLARPGWPGRLDLRRLSGGRELLLDAAHNPAGAEALASYLAGAGGGAAPPLVFAAMRDKAIGGMLAALAPAIGALVVTRASNPRSAEPSAIAELARVHAPGVPVTIAPALADALDAAWARSHRIVVAGSVFLLGDVMQRLGLH